MFSLKWGIFCSKYTGDITFGIETKWLRFEVSLKSMWLSAVKTAWVVCLCAWASVNAHMEADNGCLSLSPCLPCSLSPLSGSRKRADASNWCILLYISKLFLFISVVLHCTGHTTIHLSTSWQWPVMSEAAVTFVHRSLSGQGPFSQDKIFSSRTCRLFTKCVLKLPECFSRWIQHFKLVTANSSFCPYLQTHGVVAVLILDHIVLLNPSLQWGISS